MIDTAQFAFPKPGHDVPAKEKKPRRLRAKRDARWEKVREQLHRRAKGRCEQCGKLAPLHGTEAHPAGEGAHVERRWKGGKYDLANLRWECGGAWGCHQASHRKEDHGQCPRRVK